MGRITPTIAAELEKISQRVTDPELRAIELTMYVEEVLEVRMPTAALVDDGRDPLERVLRAVQEHG